MIRYFNGYILFPTLEKLTKRDITRKVQQLNNFELLSNEEQLKVQRQKLFEFSQYCKNNVPYYQNLFAKISFDESKILKDIKFIQDIPILTKEIVKAESNRIIQSGAFHRRKTGGSTGVSVHFFYDNPGLDWTSAINLVAINMAGKKPKHTDCHISSELGIEPPNFKAKLLDRLKLFSQNRQRLMITSFTDEYLEQACHQLKRTKPYMLQGHPSSAFAIASYIERKGFSPKKLCKIFEPSGEMLNDKMVQTIEEYLCEKVVNRYGNAESGVMAHSLLEDSYNRLKVFRRAFYIEECDNSNIIASSFTNYGFPLLRYDTGDIATVKEEKKGCFLYDIQGRIHDSVPIGNQVYPTHYIMDFLDHVVTNIKEFQILLNENSKPTLNIVPEDNDDIDRIEQEIEKKWPNKLNIKFIDHSSLIRVGWRQKFRHVIDQRGTRQ